MAKDLTKRAGIIAPKQTEDVASRLKAELMADSLKRMFGEEPKTIAPGVPRVVLALANHGRATGWDRAKDLQRGLFQATTGLEMKFAFYGADDANGVRRCRITTRWIIDPDDMAGLIDRAECRCGCFVNIRDVLAQAVKESKDRPLRAVIIVGDAFHDNQDNLDEAAIAANQLRRAGTKVFLMQLSDNPITSQKLQYLARVSGAVHFQFDPRTQEQQFADMWAAVSAYTSGGEAAVQASGGQAATLLLQHLKQVPMPSVEERAGKAPVIALAKEGEQ
jgi:hypothetical protein